MAGAFYPADAATLSSMVDRVLQDATDRTISRTPSAAGTPRPPRGLIVPHAGYRYSGPVAASAYALLRACGPAVERVVLMGPAHFVPLRGAAVPISEQWRTPLGDVRIDQDLARRSHALAVTAADEPHAPEHAVEVQLPFLQVVLGNALSVLPVAVGISDARWVADLLDALVDRGVLLVVSTDLSHYYDRETASRLDRRTAAAITARDAAAVGPDDACGVFALRGALEWSRRADVAIDLLDLRTSADTAGGPSRVVGYGAFRIG